ncbi:sulfatase-like hydrolase/transferase [Gammaproteobacteria bacterium]|nr:sulfatase-like hydrolase/transferase [Gammaproteobacteria bacterium]
MKKLITSGFLLVGIGSTIWFYKYEILIASLPTIVNISNPVEENKSIYWSKDTSLNKNLELQKKPNVIIILADDLGFNDISLYNGGAADGTLMTPNIDELANNGVRFDNGYAANAVCAPSRASIMTGRYSTRFGYEFTPFMKQGPTIWKWRSEKKPSFMPNVYDEKSISNFTGLINGMPSSEVTIAEILKDGGYYTAHIGKWHLGGYVEGSRPTDQGFDDSLMLTGSSYLPKNDPNVINAKVDSGFEDMVWATSQFSASFNNSDPFEPGGYLTDYYTDEAVKVIENNKNRPFFLYLGHWAVHNPLQSLKNDYDNHDHIKDHNTRVYASMITALDRSVGKIIQTLKDNGLYENTLIVFTSDNGGAGYLGLPDINKPFRGWKLTHFEGGMHIPFIMSWPKGIKENSIYTKNIHHNDIFPTIANVAGVTIPNNLKIDGINLLPYINGIDLNNPHETLYWKEGDLQTVIHKNMKLIRSSTPVYRDWLFDLEKDPYEQININKEYPKVIAQLNSLLDIHISEQVKPLWPSVVNTPIRIDKTEIDKYDEDDEYTYWPN